MNRINRNRIFFVVLFCFTLVVVFGQDKPRKSKDYKRTLEEADIYFNMDAWRQAAALYLQLLQQDSTDENVNLNLAICKYNLKEVPDSIMPFLKRVDRGKNPEAQLYEAKVLHQLHRFDEAIQYYQNYKTFSNNNRSLSIPEVDRLILISKRASEMMKSPVKAKIENLGPAINTQYPDYVPLITADESIMYFTSRRPGSTGGRKDVYGNFYEDIYVSEKVNGKWTEAKNLGAPINTLAHDACVGLSADGQQMIVYRTGKDSVSGDLYLSKSLGNGKWSDLILIDNQINSNYRELSACFDPNNQVLYFSSDRPGGYGGKDLYKSVLLPNGKWSMATNLGPVINTKYDEDAPFISFDNEYLFFSSKGHDNIGEYDIFRSTINPEGGYSTPENLGYPINTVGDDIFFILSADGKHGYYSSLNEDPASPNYESEDIFFIDLRHSEKDVAIRHGKTICKENGDAPVAAKITVIDVDNNKVFGVYNISSNTGKFVFMVSPFSTYKIIGESKGFETFITELKPLMDAESDEILEDLIICFKKKE